MDQTILEPTRLQILNCQSMGWIYIGEGLFEYENTGWIGYFTQNGFVKES